jgi:hypothetical protein
MGGNPITKKKKKKKKKKGCQKSKDRESVSGYQCNQKEAANLVKNRGQIMKSSNDI